MPELCRFLGILITMFYNDHAPPHFHVRYAKQKAVVGIDPGWQDVYRPGRGPWCWSGQRCIKPS